MGFEVLVETKVGEFWTRGWDAAKTKVLANARKRYLF